MLKATYKTGNLLKSMQMVKKIIEMDTIQITIMPHFEL